MEERNLLSKTAKKHFFAIFGANDLMMPVEWSSNHN